MPDFPPSRPQLFLASGSPLRIEILEWLGIPFETIPHGFDESRCNKIDPLKRARHIAAGKALSAQAQHGRAPRDCAYLAADTLIIAPIHRHAVPHCLGKPCDVGDARAMLQQLSGRTHMVVTSIALAHISLKIVTVKTFVSFARLHHQEIEDYLETGEWQGAAGAYKIQGRASIWVTHLEGSSTSVMGLPIKELYDILRRIGIFA